MGLFSRRKKESLVLKCPWCNYTFYKKIRPNPSKITVKVRANCPRCQNKGLCAELCPPPPTPKTENAIIQTEIASYIKAELKSGERLDELLVICSFLFVSERKLVSKEEFNEIVDALFAANPENELYLDLEWHSSDISDSIAIIHRHIEKSGDKAYLCYGEFLIDRLKTIYYNDNVDIESFCDIAYVLSRSVSEDFRYEEPFQLFLYAGEYLEIYGEKSVRDGFEQLFDKHGK